tara:strand:+ start:1524 stop:3005 length:1482 start_codon:yes stop_codon:yes gene_type:complete
MALIPLEIEAGIFRNGTDLQSANRWRDSNLVRWTDSTMRPVGGWQVRSLTASDAKVRGMLTWSDNSSNKFIAGGTYQKLYVWNQGGVRYDITPAGFTSGIESSPISSGYSGGLYGLDYYGIARIETTSPELVTTWSLDNWGEYLVGCTVDDGKIYEWQLDTAVVAAVVANAPVDNRALLVTEERFLFALGAGGNPRLVQWSDKEDNTLWSPAATNEAGDLELQTEGEIMCGVRVRGQSLILTTIDAHAATYQGPPYVYGIERVGSSCGIISQKAVANIGTGAVWMGRKAFFMYNGGEAQKLPSTVSDYVFSDINAGQISKVWAVTNARNSEVWWFYPSGASNECNRYVTFNYVENTWAIGLLARTSGVDHGALQRPIWASGDDNQLYDHEIGFAYGSLVPFAESGPIMIGSGDQVASVTQMIPDEKTQGEVTATFKARFYPNDVEREYGPYSMSAPTSLRLTGRQLRIRVEGQALSDWRVGVNRLDVVAGGRR